jgi:hypothetical protein
MSSSGGVRHSIWVVSDAIPVFAISMTACNTSARGTIDAAK